MPRPSAASLSPIDVLGLLDPEELAELAKQIDPLGGAEDELLALSPGRLLFEIAKMRLPFIHMMNDVATMLGTIEAKLKGNIRFIVIPEAANEIPLDFGPQLRGAVASALSRSFLAEHSQSIQERVGELDRQVRSLCQRIRPMPVDRKDQIGRMLDQRADASDPASAFRDRWLSENIFSHNVLEFSPVDIERLRALIEAMSRLEGLVNRVLAASPALVTLAAGLRDGVGRLCGVLAQKARSGPVSQGYSHPTRSTEDRHFSAAHQAADKVREAVLAASEFADALDGMYDFLNLQIWRQRWRVYELWVLVRIVGVLMEAGAAIGDRSRIIDGAWQLKFTKDSSPAIGLELDGQMIELYYQLYQGRGSTGDMPDLAVRIKGGRFVAVVDPKHGYSYSRQDLNGVCERYADAFKPFFCCVCNYFPVRATEELRRDPLSLVLYELCPNATVPLTRFESELSNALVLAFRDRGLEIRRRPGLIVLFDVSSSASGVRTTLLEALRSELARMDRKPRADSRALTFSTQVVREGSLDGLVSEAMLQGQSHGGTDFTAALRAAALRLGTLPAPTELWMFTDGLGAGDLQQLTPELAKSQSRVVIFETGNSALRSFAERVGGRHVQL